MSTKPWLRMLPRKSFLDSFYNCNSVNYARDGFLTSQSAEFVNPHHHMVISDTVWQDFDAETLAGMSDSKILSKFTSGFFGGFVFGMEGILLNAGAWRVLPVHFTNFTQDAHLPEIWRSSEVPNNEFCDVGTKLFGTFQLLNKHVSEPSGSEMSYVDYGFGSDNYSFAGCHRFSVTRHQATPDSTSETEQSKSQIRISLEGFTCNPSTNKPPVPEIGKWFHALYARALFANGVQAILESRRSG